MAAPPPSPTPSPTPPTDVVVVGAGLSGLVAARALREAGAAVTVVEADAEPGGRLSTRRLGAARLDSGAQFFTVRSPTFADLVARWTRGGAAVRVWSHGFARSPDVAGGPSSARVDDDGHPRHVIAGGMQQLARHLARDLDVRPSTRVTAVGGGTGHWVLHADPAHGRATHLEASKVLLSPPVPDTLAMIRAGGLALPADAQRPLTDVGYRPTLGLLLVLDRDPGLPEPGGVQFAGGMVSFLGDNRRKGVSPVPAVTVHADPEWSAAHYDAPTSEVEAVLLDAVARWLGGAEVLACRVDRWPHARPSRQHPERALEALPGLALCGDAFHEARVEGAALSGLAAADLLLGT